MTSIDFIQEEVDILLAAMLDYPDISGPDEPADEVIESVIRKLTNAMENIVEDCIGEGD